MTSRQPKILMHKSTVKRRKILDHFAIVVCDGPEPRIVERWPKTDAECLYELPPALPYFVCDDFFMPAAFNANNTKTAVRKKWFGRGGSTSSKNQQNHLEDAQKTFDRNTPKFYPFVLTGASGERIYGGALLRLSPNEKVSSPLTSQSIPHHDSNNQFYVEALCFLSRFPFFKLIHDMLYHIHKLSAPALQIEGFGSGQSSHTTSKQPAKRRNSIAESVNTISTNIVEEAARREPSANDIFLRVVFANAPLGLAFSNSKLPDGSTHLFVVDSKGQTGVAGIMLGDEIVELDGVKVKPGTTHEELRLKILELRKSGARSISILVRVNTPSAKAFRELPALTSSGSFSSLAGLKNVEKFSRISPLCLEQLVPHVMSKLRLPPSGGTVDIALGPGPRVVRYSRSATGTMPRVEDASFALLWRLLSVETVVKVVESLVLEQRVVLVSDDVSVLAPVAEALLSFLFPFTWSHVYIPLLPTELLMYLDAPVPFLVGISSTYLTLDVVANVLYDVDAGVTAVYLDSDTLCYPGESSPSSNTVAPQEDDKENSHKKDSQDSSNYQANHASGRDRNGSQQKETRNDNEYFPKILRDDLIASLKKSVSTLKGAAEGVPSYGVHSSFAAGATEYSAKRRKQKRTAKQRRNRNSRHGHGSSQPLFPRVPEVPESIVLDESLFDMSASEPPPSLSSSPPKATGSMSKMRDIQATEATSSQHHPVEKNKFKSMETMDLDAPRFHFVHLWTELVLPYTDFMRPHTSVETTTETSAASDGASVVVDEEKAAREAKEAKEAKDQAKADARDVHGFDTDGFLSVSPPLWRPFLKAFLGTNLFQAFNHSACESLRRDQGRSPKKTVGFFDKLTQARTLDEMRMFVDDSLCNYEEDCDVLTRILPPLSEKRTPINPSNAQVFYSYTSFPSLSAVVQPSHSNDGSAYTPDGDHTPTSSVFSSHTSSHIPLSSPNKGRPSKIVRRPSNRDELMNAFESGEFRIRPGGGGSNSSRNNSLSRTPSNSSFNIDINAEVDGITDSDQVSPISTGKYMKMNNDQGGGKARVSRRASLSGKGGDDRRFSSQSYPTGLVMSEAEDAIGHSHHAGLDKFENSGGGRLRTSSLDRVAGSGGGSDDMGSDESPSGGEEHDQFKKLASDWLTSNKEKLRLIMSGSGVSWFDKSTDYDVNAQSDAESDSEDESDEEDKGNNSSNSENEAESSTTSKVWIPVLKTVNSFRFGGTGGTDDESGGDRSSVTDDESMKRNRSIDSSFGGGGEDSNMLPSSTSSSLGGDFFQRLSTSSDGRRPSFWSDMFSDSDTDNLQNSSNGVGSNQSSTATTPTAAADSLWGSLQAQFSSPVKVKGESAQSTPTKTTIVGSNIAEGGDGDDEEEEEEERSSIFEKLHDDLEKMNHDLFASPSKPFWGVFGASSP